MRRIRVTVTTSAQVEPNLELLGPGPGRLVGLMLRPEPADHGQQFLIHVSFSHDAPPE